MSPRWPPPTRNSWPRCCSRHTRSPPPRASPRPATGWCSTPARRPVRPSSTCTPTYWAAATCGGRRAKRGPRFGGAGGPAMGGLRGSREEVVQVVERALTGDIHVRGNEITVSGPEAEIELVAKLFNELIEMVRNGNELTPDAVERSIAMLRASGDESPAEVLNLGIISSRGRTIRPKTLNQKRYVDAI